MRAAWFLFSILGLCMMQAAGPARAQAGCVGPAKPAGAVFFNSDQSLFQYCDGLSWISMHKPPSEDGGGGCDTTPVQYDTPGTYVYETPAGCGSLVLQAYGAGGGGNAGGREGGAGGGGGSVAERLDGTLLVAGGGGGGGGADDDSGGGGGGYGTATVTVSPGEELNLWVGSGGSPSNGLTGGGAGGGVGGGSAVGDGGNGNGSTYGGGSGSGDDATGSGGGDTTYGGGGGVGKDNSNGYGGSSVYGGGGGGSDGSDGPGTSTEGRNGLNGDGGGGGGGGGFGDLVMLGGNGATEGTAGGAAANGGPGYGATGNTTGGPGSIVITPQPGGPVTTCSDPDVDRGAIIYNEDLNMLQGCAGGEWSAFGPEHIGAGAGCTDPVKPAGTMMFSGDCDVMQYCNGDEWIAMGKTPGLWTPDELGAQLVAWYDFSGASRVTEIDDAVSAVIDKSGNGNDLAQGTALNRPPRDEGTIGSYAKALRIDSSNQTLATTAASVRAAVNGTNVAIFAVAQRDAAAGGGTRPTVVRNNAGGTNFDLYENPEGTRVGVHNGTAIVTGGVLTPGEPRLYGAVRSGTNLRIYNFGTELLNSNSAVASNPTQVNISGPTTGLWWGGHIGEVIYTSGVLSAANRQRIEGYLAHHWWLAAYLPPGHPYKDAPPRDADCN